MSQQIPKGTWGRSHEVDFYLVGNFQGVITKNEALAKVTEYSKQQGYKITTGQYVKSRKNYLVVVCE